MPNVEPGAGRGGLRVSDDADFGTDSGQPLESKRAVSCSFRIKMQRNENGMLIPLIFHIRTWMESV